MKDSIYNSIGQEIVWVTCLSMPIVRQLVDMGLQDIKS